ncbi:MAG TPA: prolipoprotein diacylglyceryl transferase family protein [Acidimicrobiales bacterium]|nr:prolipoprotein diacylglyceryl transferase family protein [Acidimicrobiales bacterium]
MKPVPVVFHLGPLNIHTYGIGLAITFWFGLVYTNHRLRARGLDTAWMNRAFLWIVAAAIVGARVVHVAAHAGYYGAHPADIVAIWHGGLSSFGGLLFAVPTGLWFAWRHCRELCSVRGLDFIAPVLMASWALGRLLGPNFEINGGGLPTTAWYGLHYAGQVGYRIPVPIFQCLESFGVFLVLLAVERWVRAANGPTGLVFFLMMGLWGVTRFFDEYLWLAAPPVWDAVEATGITLAVVGLSVSAVLVARHLRRRPVRTGGAPVGANGAGGGDQAGTEVTATA